MQHGDRLKELLSVAEALSGADWTSKFEWLYPNQSDMSLEMLTSTMEKRLADLRFMQTSFLCVGKSVVDSLCRELQAQRDVFGK